jgi:hypothetical protein
MARTRWPSGPVNPGLLPRPGRSDRQRRWVPKAGTRPTSRSQDSPNGVGRFGRQAGTQASRPHQAKTTEARPKRRGRARGTIHILPADSASPLRRGSLRARGQLPVRFVLPCPVPWGPRAGRPKRRTFTLAYKLAIVEEYDQLAEGRDPGGRCCAARACITLTSSNGVRHAIRVFPVSRPVGRGAARRRWITTGCGKRTRNSPMSWPGQRPRSR